MRGAALLLSLSLTVLLCQGVAAQDEEWVIRSFDAALAVDPSGSLTVTEDIRVDFGALERHGIFRDIPLRYRYDSERVRVTPISNITVDDGSSPVPHSTSREGNYLRLRIGDPDVFVSGEQRYRVSYNVEGTLNPFGDRDELYWNVTGNGWPVPIERASATVELPDGALQSVACYQGVVGSTDECSTSTSGRITTFASTTALAAESGMTLVMGTNKGAIAVDPPILEDAEQSVSEQFSEMFRLDALVLLNAALLSVLVLLAVARAWWLIGRDRWYGDNYYLTDGPPPRDDAPRPMFAHRTVVVEYEPPPAGHKQRRMRPAEIGLLLDERADTLDVSATIVDLAVRKHIVITELAKDGIFGAFKSQDYQLQRLVSPGGDTLLPYEERLLKALFKGEASVTLSALKNEFFVDLKAVKSELYEEAVLRNRFFPGDPEKVRSRYRTVGIVAVLGGGAMAWFLGSWFGAGIIGIPVIAGGVLVVLTARIMPSRTALGWHTYRRCLGFRTFMVTAETDRQRFAEEASIFHEYLPYAIVYGCVEKWAKTFEALGVETGKAGYFVSSRPFAVVHFADSMNGFSNSISGAMASTPGGSGGSGFGGGGGSGGGVGGGGGGSW
jgi:uncharacterized membrane protein YgcG